MRRLTIWLTTALAIAAMGFYYNLSLSGDGKDGDGSQFTLPAASHAAESPTITAPTGVAGEEQTTPTPSPSSTPTSRKPRPATTSMPAATTKKPAPISTPHKAATPQPTRTATPQPAQTPAAAPPSTSEGKTGGTPNTHVDKTGEHK